MPRLFLACPLPLKAAHALAEWSQGHLGLARLVKPEDMHMTVKFYGEDDLEARIKETLAIRWEPVAVKTGPLARFGRTAIALRLIEVSGRLPTNPHVTLARSKASFPLPPPPPSLQFTLDRLVLFESLLGRAGAEYRVRAEAPR